LGLLFKSDRLRVTLRAGHGAGFCEKDAGRPSAFALLRALPEYDIILITAVKCGNSLNALPGDRAFCISLRRGRHPKRNEDGGGHWKKARARRSRELKKRSRKIKAQQPIGSILKYWNWW